MPKTIDELLAMLFWAFVGGNIFALFMTWMVKGDKNEWLTDSWGKRHLVLARGVDGLSISRGDHPELRVAWHEAIQMFPAHEAQLRAEMEAQKLLRGQA